LFAFLFDAPRSVVELARGVSLVGVLLVMAYYMFRASKNVIRSFKQTFGSKSEADKNSHRRRP